MKYAVGERGGEAVALLMRDADEEDLLRGRAADAARRVVRAVRELVSALLAFAGYLLAEALLARARREVWEESEGAAVGAELSVLALEKVVCGRAGRILGRRRMLSLGARLVPEEGEERLLWCVKRLRKHGGDGAWRFVEESRDPFAGAALIRFFSEPRIPPALPPAPEETAGKGASTRPRRRGAVRGGASRKGAALARSA